VRLPTESAADVAHLPLVTLAAAVVMSALVAGVVEEIVFRGYLQGTLERRHGVVISILVCGVLFALAHFARPETTLALAPYYMAVAAVYGALAYLTNSVLPSLLLHTLGNIAGSTQLILGGRSEWQAARAPAPLVWTSGLDSSFWLTVAVTAILAAAAVAAYAYLARVVQGSRSDSAATAPAGRPA